MPPTDYAIRKSGEPLISYGLWEPHPVAGVRSNVAEKSSAPGTVGPVSCFNADLIDPSGTQRLGIKENQIV